jgi:hypothetical protein
MAWAGHITPQALNRFSEQVRNELHDEMIGLRTL